MKFNSCVLLFCLWTTFCYSVRISGSVDETASISSPSFETKETLQVESAHENKYGSNHVNSEGTNRQLRREYDEDMGGPFSLESCPKLSSIQSPFWQPGFFTLFLSSNNDINHYLQLVQSWQLFPSLDQCLGQATITLLDVIRFASNGNCRKTFKDLFPYWDLSFSNYGNFTVNPTLSEVLQQGDDFIEMAQKDFIVALSNLVHYVRNIPNQPIANACVAMKDHIHQCVEEEVLPFIASNVRGQCCETFVEEFQDQTGQSFGHKTLQKYFRMILQLPCTQQNIDQGYGRTCGYSLLQFFSDERVLEHLTNAMQLTDDQACNFYQGRRFNSTIKKNNRAVNVKAGCCMNVIDSISIETSKIPFFKNQLGHLAYSKEGCMKATESKMMQKLSNALPTFMKKDVDQLIRSLCLHVPTQFSQNCHTEDHCDVPNYS